jgi:hypothetical protein
MSRWEGCWLIWNFRNRINVRRTQREHISSGLPRNRTSTPRLVMSQKGHVWTAPSWQGESSRRRLGRCSQIIDLYTVEGLNHSDNMGTPAA